MKKSAYNSKGKLLVLNYFINNPDIIVSADDIYQALKKECEKINLTTVYRNLDKLVADNIILVFSSDDRKKSGYKFAGEGFRCKEHLHLQCTQCGKIIHLDCHFMSDIEKHVSNKHSFDIKYTSSILYGVCNDCKNKKL